MKNGVQLSVQGVPKVCSARWNGTLPVWPATTALRASVAFKKVRMRYAKPYRMVPMLFCVPNMR